MVVQAELTGRHFLRVSKDKSGRERSNEEQQDDNERHWAFTFQGDPYREVASASRFATRSRDEFPRLLDDLATNRFAADVLVMWEGTRGSRKVSEWVQLIEACEEAGVRIAITDHDRIYSPANARDRKDLIDGANDAEYEAARSSGRIRRAAERTALAGRSVGPVNYGYRRVYNETTREFIRQEPDPVEAPRIVELFDRLEAGHSALSIERDWIERGIQTRSGKPFRAGELARMAKNPAYIGKRSHLPATQWRKLSASERRKTATLVDAWTPIVPERQWLAVQRMIDTPAQPRRTHTVHVYTRTIRCDHCGGPLGVRLSPSCYYCLPGGCVQILKPQLDELLEAAILGFLAQPGNVTAIVGHHDDNKLDAVRLEIAQVRAELDDLADQLRKGPTNGGISAALAAQAEPGILARLADAERRERELTTPSELLSLIEPGGEVSARWEAMPVSAKRRLARILFSPDWLGEVRVVKAYHRFIPTVERVRWRKSA